MASDNSCVFIVDVPKSLALHKNASMFLVYQQHWLFDKSQVCIVQKFCRYRLTTALSRLGHDLINQLASRDMMANVMYFRLLAKKRWRWNILLHTRCLPASLITARQADICKSAILE
ncbi:MAG: hypothetical protein ACEY3J_00980 [Arsenophonus sp.]